MTRDMYLRVPNDLTGYRSGMLVAVSRVEGRGQAKWLCRCDCGADTVVKRGNLIKRDQPQRSCGCAYKKRKGLQAGNFRHGHSYEPEFNIWRGMITRCTDSRSQSWKHYGGRGITVCQRWINSYEAFRADVGARPSPKHSIDRVNNDGNYEPSNVRWATAVEQANNTRVRQSCRKLTFNGRTLSIREWGAELGITPTAIERCLDISKWSVEQTLSTPKCQGEIRSDKARRNDRPIEFDGRSQNVSAWAREVGLTPSCLYNRVFNYGWTVARALAMPRRRV